jgi:nicotinamide mononucleotide transporter
MNRTLAIMTAAASVIAIIMAVEGIADWLETASFITGAVCVWLTVVENVWNFPIGLVNSATYCIVFFKASLFADGSLQIIYFVLGVIGWWMWLYGGENRTKLMVTCAPLVELIALIACVIGGTFGLWYLLQSLGGSASFFDALTTSISLAAQWLLNGKRLENWYGWILADIIYVPLYFYKHLYLTALLYAVFLIMATMRLRAWLQNWRLSQITVHPGVALEPNAV